MSRSLEPIMNLPAGIGASSKPIELVTYLSGSSGGGGSRGSSGGGSGRSMGRVSGNRFGRVSSGGLGRVSTGALGRVSFGRTTDTSFAGPVGEAVVVLCVPLWVCA